MDVAALATRIEPALPFLITVAGAIIAWLAVHRVAHLSAKRDAYGRYVGAAEIYANDHRRWAEARQRGVPSTQRQPIRADPVNEPLGAILLVAPPKIGAMVQEAQEALAGLNATADGGGWDEAYDRWTDIRDRLINAMRADSGSRPFPKDYFARR